MEKWCEVWRVAAKILPILGLVALRDALERDDPRLIQGATTSPPPLQCVQDWPVEAACGLAYAGVPGAGGFLEKSEQTPVKSGVLTLPVAGPYATVADVEEFFARVCFEVDTALGEPAGCRFFLNWFDETPRDEMRRELLPEVVLALSVYMTKQEGTP